MKYIFLFCFFLGLTPVFAQSKLPVIRATSNKVAINDGGYLDKNRWTLSPAAKPDVLPPTGPGKPNGLLFIQILIRSVLKLNPDRALIL